MRMSNRRGILVVFVVLVLIAVQASAAPLTIATWNLRNLGSSSDVLDRAEIIQQFDIVALQEILSIEGLNNLLACVESITCDDWDVVTSPKVGEGGAAEFYAFMFRTDSVSYIEESSGVYQESSPDDFAREPFFASFRAGKFDFTLITVHITWGDLASLRTAECQRLQSVWDYVQNMDLEEDDLILLGDFNRDKPTHSAFDQLLQMGITSILTETGTRTTFGRTAAGGSWYDHIWIDARYTNAELTGEIGVGTPTMNTSGEGCATALEGVSDHCPVWAVFDTTVDDDPSSD